MEGRSVIMDVNGQDNVPKGSCCDGSTDKAIRLREKSGTF